MNYYKRKTIEIYKVIPIVCSLAILLGVVLASQSMEGEKQTFINPLVEEVQAKEMTVKYKFPEGVEGFIEYLWGDEAENAKKVFRCESGLRENARNINRNGSTDNGVAQINSVHGIKEKWLKDYRINLLVAYKLWQERGWNPWVCQYVLEK